MVARTWNVDGKIRVRRMSPGTENATGGPSSPEGRALTTGLVTTRLAIVLGYACRLVRMRSAAFLLVFATTLPRLAALLHERGAILASLRAGVSRRSITCRSRNPFPHVRHLRIPLSVLVAIGRFLVPHFFSGAALVEFGRRVRTRRSERIVTA
jgi:hypothetical protein